MTCIYSNRTNLQRSDSLMLTHNVKGNKRANQTSINCFGGIKQWIFEYKWFSNKAYLG